MPRRRGLARLLCLTLLSTYGFTPCGVAGEGLEYEPLGTVDVMVVIEITAANGAVSNVTASGPLLLDWPAQKIELVARTTSPGARAVDKSEPGVAAWVEIVAPRIPAGGRVTVTRTYRVTRSAVTTNLPITKLETVERPSRAMRRHLGTAPGVVPRERRIRELAAATADRDDPAGTRAIAFARWVRDNIRYEFDPVYRGAETCLETKIGDCDDMSSLFISLCRASSIPARTIWIEDHAYAEFLLVDPDGEERWVPVDLASRSPVGSVRQVKPILQKGDGFVDPFTRRRVHYVPQGVRAVGAPVAFRSERRILATRPAE